MILYAKRGGAPGKIHCPLNQQNPGNNPSPVLIPFYI